MRFDSILFHGVVNVSAAILFRQEQEAGEKGRRGAFASDSAH